MQFTPIVRDTGARPTIQVNKKGATVVFPAALAAAAGLKAGKVNLGLAVKQRTTFIQLQQSDADGFTLMARGPSLVVQAKELLPAKQNAEFNKPQALQVESTNNGLVFALPQGWELAPGKGY